MEKKSNPESKASFFSHLCLLWLTSLVKIAIKRQLTQEDLFELPEENEAEIIVQDFEQAWQDEILKSKKNNRKPRLWKAMVKFLKWKEYLATAFMKIVETVGIYSKPLLLWLFLKFLTEEPYSECRGYYVGFTLGGIAVANILQVLSLHHNRLLSDVMGMRLTIGCTGLIFKKVLASSRTNMSKETPGHVFNLVSNDMHRIRDIINSVLYSLAFITVFPIAFTLLCTLLQWQAISGALFIILCGFSQVFVSKGYAFYQKLQALATDKRLAVVSEVIKGIRTVKANAWEWHYLDVLKNLRRKETNLAKIKSCLLAVTGIFHFILSLLSIAISIFSLFILGLGLDTVHMFVLINILHSMGESITRQINCTLHAYDSYTAVVRIEKFLLSKGTPSPKAIKEKTFYKMKGTIAEETTKTSSMAQTDPPQMPKYTVLATKKHSLSSASHDTSPNSKLKDKHPSYINRLVNRVSNIFKREKIEYSVLPTDEPAFNVPQAPTYIEERQVSYVEMKELNSSWECNDSPTLSNISLDIKSKMLMMVTGPVGCGKTTLLMTLLQEIPILSGQLDITGKIAYVSQIPWIFTGTLRENILFGLPFDEAKYQQVLEACDLHPDISNFPNGDMSMIGQRGIMLSGGQRARVGLARAAYSDADIMLLDDPLSAVDAKVGEHILNKCICDRLKDKIRILVTHQLQYLKRADQVLVLKEGRIAGKGTYEDLTKDQDLYHLIADHRSVNETETKSAPSGYTAAKDNLDRERGMDLAEEDEGSESRYASWRLYWFYVTSGLRGWLVVCLLIYFQFALAFPFCSSWWLRNMAVMSFEEQRSAYTLGIYGGIVVGNIVFPFLAIYLLLMVLLRSSVSLYDKMALAVLKAPTVFFDKNPVGRIMNRFSKDMGVIDDDLPLQFVFGLSSFFPFFVIITFVMIINFWFLVVTLPALVTFLVLLWYYVGPVRDLSRLEALLCSPIYDHVSETVDGLEVIHAANMEERSMRKLYRLQNSHSKAFYLSFAMERAVCLYTGLLCAVFVTLVVSGSVMLDLHPATCGLIFVVSMSMMRIISLGVQLLSRVETAMVSVERVMRYTELPSEPGYSRPDVHPPKAWPNTSTIQIQQLNFKYFEKGAYVLKDINLDVKPRERVGIAGRTGAGKSSLVAALLRMPDPEGRVIIDGIDLATLNIQEARRSMAVISQNPILFSGTLKRNLDPFSCFTDVQLWDALDVVQMKERVAKLDDGLEYKIGGGGSGFSVGETQLLCLARALLQKSKILVLDEATANVDYKTDKLVQQVIREKFANCAVLTIAHRLNTIMDYDRIVVMEQGHVVEFDTPAVLAAKPDGIFAKLIQSQK